MKDNAHATLGNLPIDSSEITDFDLVISNVSLFLLSDVIIGAPHDGPDLDGDGVGNGAIYIYHGLASGDIKEYKQVYKQETNSK